MPASQKTAALVIAIVKKYLPVDKALELLRELEGVPGNSSFKVTITMLRTLLEGEAQKK